VREVTVDGVAQVKREVPPQVPSTSERHPLTPAGAPATGGTLGLGVVCLHYTSIR
jgi:hypothetical protein